MKTTRKFFCLFLALLMLVPALVGCNSGSGSNSTDTDAAASDDAVETNALGEVIPSVPNKKYDGEDFTVLMTCRNNDEVIVRDFSMDEADASLNVLNEAVYKRNLQMQQEFDIKIVPEVDYKSTNTGTDKVKRANTSGESLYDLCILGTYSASNLAMSGELADLNNYGHIDLSKSWWDQNVNEQLAVGGKVYYTAGDISLVATQAMYGLMFNKEMFDAYKMEYPYQLVRENKWTFEEMKKLSKQVSEDNGDRVMNAYDTYGFGWINSTCIAFLNASGEKIANVNDEGKIELTITSERAASAVIDYIEFTKDTTHTINGQTACKGLTDITAIGMFANGQLLFRAGEHLCFPHLRDTELNYGILPLPMYDEGQDRYYTPVGSWDASYVCIPTSTTDVERTSTIIERTAYVSSIVVTPAYYERTLEGKYVRDEESYDMITIEIENRTYDIGYMFEFGEIHESITTLSVNGRTQFASVLRSLQGAAEKEIKETNEEFFGK